jgi:predicted metal-dependent hydrolase
MDIGNELKFLRHPRARRYQLAVLASGVVRLTLPKYGTKKAGLEFASRNSAWIEAAREKILKSPKKTLSSGTRKEYLKLRNEARRIICSRVDFFSGILKVESKRIAIRNQSSRWGSCSKKGNLNFNYRLIRLPERLADYVIVHELCHLKEFNHSERFWNLVRNVFPDYKKIRSELRKI